MDEEREPYTLAQAAARLHVSESWLQKEARLKRIPHVKLGRTRVFMEKHIAMILKECEVLTSTGLTEGSLRSLRREMERKGRRPA